MAISKNQLSKLVRKGGLEPPCLSAPPPQDGVSANFTTSAYTAGQGFPSGFHAETLRLIQYNKAQGPGMKPRFRTWARGSRLCIA